MESLKKIFTTENTMKIAIFAGGLYLLYIIIKDKKPLEIKEVKSASDIPNNTTKEQAEKDCKSSTSNMRFDSKKSYDEYISTCVKGKLNL